MRVTPAAGGGYSMIIQRQPPLLKLLPIEIFFAVALFNNVLPSRGGEFDSHRNGSWTADVRPGRKAEMTLVLRDTGNWYDLQVTVDSDPSFMRRLAGRIETGHHTVSDPAMGISDGFQG